MANFAAVPAQWQILVDIEDMSMLKDIKRAIGLMRGVGKITVPRRKKCRHTSVHCVTLTKDGCMNTTAWTTLSRR